MILFKNKGQAEGGGVFILKGNQKEVDSLLVDLKGQLEKIRHDVIMHSYQDELKLNDCDLKNLTVGDKKNYLAKWANVLAQENDVTISLESGKAIIQGLKKSVDQTKQVLVERLASLANTVTEALIIDPRFHSVLIGSGGKNLKHLQRKYSVHASFPPLIVGTGEVDESSTPSDRVTITGPKEGVRAAKEELLDLYKYWAERSYKEQIKVPQDAIASLVGKGGATIDELRNQFDVDIDIERGSASSLDEKTSDVLVNVTITGSKQNAISTICHIEAIVKAVQSSISVSIPVTADQIKKLKGPASQAYRAWLKAVDFGITKNKTTITTTTTEQASSVLNRQTTLTVRDGKVFKIEGTNEIIISGPESQVKEAVDSLNVLLEALSTWTTVVLRVPVHCHREIIGAHGDNIRSICAAHSVNIDIGRVDAEAISITGRLEDVKAAEGKVWASAKDRRVIPMKSRDLKRAMLSEGTKLFKASHPSTRLIDTHEGIVIVGPMTTISAAEALLEDHLKSTYGSVQELSVPRDQHRMIIGAGGKNIHQVRERTGCLVILPEQDEATTTVQVRGSTQTAVLSAVDLIRTFLKSNN